MDFGLIENHDENIPECLNEYLNYLSVVCGKSADTITGYKADLNIFLKFMKMFKEDNHEEKDFETVKITGIDNEFLETITLKDIYYFLAFAERTRKNSNYAKARKVASIKSFFRYMCKANGLKNNPSAELETPKIKKTNPVYMELEECKKLLQSIGGRYEDRDRCIITLFLNCGLRLSELCSIDVGDIREGILTVTGKGNKERTVYLNDLCVKEIEKCLKARDKYKDKLIDKNALFISRNFRRINKRSVEKLVKKHLGSAGLDINKFSPHKLRHSAATLMYKYGNVDIRSLQYILGHNNVSTTQIYTHLDDKKLRMAANLNPLNS